MPSATEQLDREGMDKISAYYSLAFPNVTYYPQTLSVTIGRRSVRQGAASSSDSTQVDIDLGPLKSVSRYHARIEWEDTDDRFVLVVLGRNGAWVDGIWSGSGSRVPLAARQVVTIIYSQRGYFGVPGYLMVALLIITNSNGGMLNVAVRQTAANLTHFIFDSESTCPCRSNYSPISTDLKSKLQPESFTSSFHHLPLRKILLLPALPRQPAMRRPRLTSPLCLRLPLCPLPLRNLLLYPSIYRQKRLLNPHHKKFTERNAKSATAIRSRPLKSCLRGRPSLMRSYAIERSIP